MNGKTISVPGTFAYTSAAGAVLKPGFWQTENVTFTPTDTTDYAAVTTSVVVNVLPLGPPPNAMTAANRVFANYGQ